jgi:hypothetical protein
MRLLLQQLLQQRHRRLASVRRTLSLTGVAAAVALMVPLLLAGVFPQARAASESTLLPNLVADPPDGMILETSTIEGSTHLLLRFNGYVHNTGPGAVDFRGSREKPTVKGKTEKELQEEIEAYKTRGESLPQNLEEELAKPSMKLFQRLYTTNEGNPKESEKYLERPHVEEPSSGEMFYVNADGHHHWHLQHVAKYSLWNAGKSAEVAPAQKVGFCLEDSEHVETSKGPSTPVYADNVPPYRRFCRQFEPNATNVYEGISPGWRDVYSRELALQWVDASNVLPGEYWLREEVDPTAVIKQAGGGEKTKFATSSTVIPGFDALASSASATPGEATPMTLTSKAWNDTATPKYTIVSKPKHGTLGTVSGNQVSYTPEAGYTGTDSFTFSAADPNSPFPHSPAVATVSIEVAAGGGGKTLLAGDGTSTYSVSDQTAGGREETFQFTAKASGTVEEMLFRTDGTANTGVTGLKLGILSENAGKPGEVLGQASVTGEPPTNSWIKAAGLSTALVTGTKYWLAVLPLGASTTRLHYNVAAALSAGTGNLESVTGGLSALTPESSWETYNQGPIGFQALGAVSGGAAALATRASTSTGIVSSPHLLVASGRRPDPAIAASRRTRHAAPGPRARPPAVMIEGAPSTLTAGTSVQLAALVAGGSARVRWTASAGSITPGGVYVAPARPPLHGTAVVRASANGAHDQRTVVIVAPARQEPAPTVYLPESSRVGTGAGRSGGVLPTPQAMFVGRDLVITTGIGEPGRARIEAYFAGRRLGGCTAQTPAGRNFTCVLTLPARSVREPIRVSTSLQVGREVFRSGRPSAPIGPMTMVAQQLRSGSAYSLQFVCSPLLK